MSVPALSRPPVLGASAAPEPRTWFRVTPNPDARRRLVCFPYAGGGAGLFRGWPERMGPEVELWAAQLPGREARRNEPAESSVMVLARALAAALAVAAGPPWVFFGYSMGALLAFETTRELRRLGVPGPESLVVAACEAPHLERTKPHTYALPDAQFRRELARLAGTPPELLANDELMALMLPTLRADFAACQTYVGDVDQPLACPIVAIAGAADAEVVVAAMQPWQVHTAAAFSLHTVPGDHFFIHTEAEALCALLAGVPRAAQGGRERC